MWARNPVNQRGAVLAGPLIAWRAACTLRQHRRRKTLVLAYWGGIGVLMGVIAFLIMRARGEQGYNIVGEMMLGALGSLSAAMSLGVMFGWGQMFTRSGTMEDIIASGLTAAAGAFAV